ncbi:hypothetical protein [Phaeocystidibacter luteus]|uniref:hypothetical protein n=1 Tax=Phaeocystidibacter luteus TaxID=911197 RepID=UPI001478FD1C|nr:hypothetical protein [Phaeocystidibacter luteus]
MKLKTFSILSMFILFGFVAYAQPGNPSTPAPLGFTELLIGAGLVYGGFKMKKKSNRF